MTNAPPKKRSWFHFHPVTIVFLLASAGVLWWLQGAFGWRSGAVHWGFPLECFADNSIDSYPNFIVNLVLGFDSLVLIGLASESVARRRLPRFQLRLSTCVVLMFVAGVLV